MAGLTELEHTPFLKVQVTIGELQSDGTIIGGVDDEKIDYCKEMMAKAEKLGKKLLLPVDTVVCAGFPDPIDAPVDVTVVKSSEIPADREGLDIGTETQKLFAEAVKTAKMSGADSFIRKLPYKYSEKIDPSRDDISEGQRQLLSITRAMASDPCILILDEATSSVDILTEVKIQKAVKGLLRGRTSLVIAHRLSTIVDADMIVVMENGKVSDIGRHEDMIDKGGFYSRLYKSYTE